MRVNIIAFTILIVTCLSSFAQTKTTPLDQQEELGLVSWYRDYDEAIIASKTKNKPILILFQEVPGCSTCKKYGNNIIGNPLLAEITEQFFIPLLIHNNKQGDDKKVLDKYNEPAWNNPVVRIIDSNGKNLIKRISGIYTPKGFYDRINSFFIQEKILPPIYFSLLGEELDAKSNNRTKTVYYKTYCFWTGQKIFGGINGVLSTETAHSNKGELVKIEYDQSILSLSELKAIAKQNNYTITEKDRSYTRAIDDDNFYLKKTSYKHLPLTNIQKTKINSALGDGKDPKKYLSPQQQIWLNKPSSFNTTSLTDISFKDAWITQLKKGK